MSGPARIEVTIAITTRATNTSSLMIPTWSPVVAKMIPVAPRALRPQAIAHASRPTGRPAAFTPISTDTSFENKAKKTTVITSTGLNASMKSVPSARDEEQRGEDADRDVAERLVACRAHTGGDAAERDAHEEGTEEAAHPDGLADGGHREQHGAGHGHVPVGAREGEDQAAEQCQGGAGDAAPHQGQRHRDGRDGDHQQDQCRAACGTVHHGRATHDPRYGAGFLVSEDRHAHYLHGISGRPRPSGYECTDARRSWSALIGVLPDGSAGRRSLTDRARWARCLGDGARQRSRGD